MSFKWYQNTSSVTISFVVPPAVKTKENLDVVITPTSIRAGPKGGPPVIEANLHAQLKPQGCTWSIKGNTAVIVLDKAVKARWTELFSKAPPDSRKRVKVLYDYAAQDSVELTIKEDDVLYVIKEDPSGWWKGELAGKIGLFPSNFVEELPPAKPMQEPAESPEPDPDPSDQTLSEPASTEATPSPSERGGVAMPGLGGQDALAELKNKLANRKPGNPAPKEPPKEPAPAPAPTRVALKSTRGPPAPKETAPAPAPAAAPAPAPKSTAPPKEPAPAPAPVSNPPPAARGGPAPVRGAPASQPGPQPVKVALRPTKKDEPQSSEPAPAPAAAPTKAATRPLAKQSTPPPSESQSAEKEDFKKKLEAQQKAALSGSGGARSSVLITVNSAEGGTSPIVTMGSLGSASATDEGSRKGSFVAQKPKAVKSAASPVPKCQAQYDYDAQADGELTFKEGDIIIIKLRDESGWWQGDLNGQVGWFPANFVEELPLETPPPEPEPAEEETVEEKLQEVVSGSPRLEAVKRVGGASGRKPPSLRKTRAPSNQNTSTTAATPAPAATPAATQPLARTPTPAPAPAAQTKAKATTAPSAAPASNGEAEVKKPALKAVKKAEPAAAPPPVKEEAAKQQPTQAAQPTPFKKAEPSGPRAALGGTQLRASRLINSSSGTQQWPIELGGSFEEFCEELVAIFNDVKSRTKEGSPYQVIPSLSRQDPRWFGFGICSVDGKSYYHGDDVSFTLHGISWPMLYILAAEENPEDKITSLCGSESGPIYGLNLTSDKKPQNPFVAAGAIALASLIQTKNDELTRLMNVSDRFAAITGQQQLSSSIPSYLSLQLHASQEAMIAYNLKANGVLSVDVDVKRVLDFYFQVCSIQTTVQQAAVSAATLANGGMCPTTNQKCFDAKVLKKLGPNILNFGTNEHSEALSVHAQSSISGAITIVIPKVMGLCVYAPGVDQSFVSSRALEFVKILLEKFPTLKNFKF